MAVKGSSSSDQQKPSRSFTIALSSAALEWLLMFMLFISALYSYLITKFARYCKLQIPCLLCSRLDHIFGKEKPGYLWHMICATHRLEISSLVACHAHNTLVDVHGMCENCLFSFATINKSNAETYRLLVGKLGEEPKDDLDEDPLLEGQTVGNQKTKSCSCCNDLLTSRGNVHRLIHRRSFENEGVELDLPLTSPDGQNQDNLNINQDTSCMPVDNAGLGRRQFDSLSHVGYREVKINSDTESEVSLSNEDEGEASALVYETTFPDIDITVRCEREPRIITLADDSVMEKLIKPSPGHESLLPASTVDSIHDDTESPTVAIEHQTEELNQKEDKYDANPSAQVELISLDDVPQVSSTEKFPAEVSKENNFSSRDDYLKHVQVTEENKLVPNDDVAPPPTKATDIPFEVPDNNELASPVNATSTNATADPGEVSKDQCQVQPVPVSGVEAIDKSGTTVVDAETSGVVDGRSTQGSSPLDLGDAYKLALGNRGKQLSGVLAEQWFGKDSSRVSEDLKLLLSQLSTAWGFDQLATDMSPKLSMNSDDYRASDPSTSTGMQILQKRISLERNGSNISLDGSIVSEIEGESEVDRLKRQVEHDRIIIKSLYKELEEERNASAVAASQAMAMITRLQEEKAAIHMEALQSVRMMEEQAEYDMDDLQKTKDLLAEKEKEIQDLGAALEFYRQRYPNEPILDDPADLSCDVKPVDIGVDYSEPRRIESTVEAQRVSVTETPNIFNIAEGTDLSYSNILTSIVNISLFDDEASHIQENLKSLEKKLFLLADTQPGSTHVELAGNEAGQIPLSEKFDAAASSQVNSGEKDDNDAQESLVCEENNVIYVRHEISCLNARLEALEADRRFLTHSICALKGGKEGLECIQEIALNLRELREITTRKVDHSVA